jgi:DNA repair photolyase
MGRILTAARDAGAQWAGYVLLRLPHAVAPLFEDWLTHHFPDRKEKVLGRLRDMRGGKLYDSTWGERGRGTGEMADQIGALFRAARRKAGFTETGWPELSVAGFRRPHPHGSSGSLMIERQGIFSRGDAEARRGGGENGFAGQ